MLVFETSGVGSIPAWPAKIMYFIPLELSKIISVNPNPTPGKTSWRLVDSRPYLLQLGLMDLINDVYTLSIWTKPLEAVEIHKDQEPNGGGIKWSMVIAPIGHEDVTLEIFNQTVLTNNDECVSMAGDNKILFLKVENAELVDSWDMQTGPCVFNAYNEWHRIVNRSNQFRNLISIRSTNVELSDLIKKINPL